MVHLPHSASQQGDRIQPPYGYVELPSPRQSERLIRLKVIENEAANVLEAPPSSGKKLMINWSKRVVNKVRSVNRPPSTHLSEATPQEQQLMNSLNQQISESEKALDKVLIGMNRVSAQSKREEEEYQRSEPFPSSSDMLQKAYHAINAMKEEQKKAREIVNPLEEKKVEVAALANKYPQFGLLLEKIEKLTREVVDLENQIDLAEQLLEFETCIKKYVDGGEKWGRFDLIMAAEEEVAKRRTRWLGSRARSLKGYWGELEAKNARLSTQFREIKEARVDRLRARGEAWAQLLRNFSSLEKRILQLEARVEHNSLGWRVYRSLFGKERLEARLQKAKTSFAERRKEVEEIARFDPVELRCLDANPHITEQRVHQALKTVVEEAKMANSRSEAYKKLDELHEGLKQYACNARFHDQATAEFRMALKKNLLERTKQLAQLSDPSRTDAGRTRGLGDLRSTLLKRFPELERKIDNVWDSMKAQSLDDEAE